MADAFTLLRWRHLRTQKPGLTCLNLGCGQRALKGYLNIDIVPSPATDFVADIADLSFLESDTYDEIRMDAVFEHLWRWQQAPCLRHCHRALSATGCLVLNWLPDFEMIVRLWQQGAPGQLGEVFSLYEVDRYIHGDPDPHNAPHQIHKDLFTRESIVHRLLEAGFPSVGVENVCFGQEPYPLNLKVVASKGKPPSSAQHSLG